MKLDNVLKLNQATQGYSFVQSGNIDSATLDQIARAFPQPKYFERYSSLSGGRQPRLPLLPCVSFSCSLFPDADMALLVVGSFWINLLDETGRPGLSMWHGLLCRDLKFSRKPDRAVLSGLLYNLAVSYHKQFDDVGKRVADLAVNANENVRREIHEWFFDRQRSMPNKVDMATSLVVNSVLSRLRTISPPYNLYVAEPFSSLVAIPLLVEVGTSAGLNVAGGLLDVRELPEYACISIERTIGSHKLVRLSELLQESQLERKPRFLSVLRSREDLILSAERPPDLESQIVNLNLLEGRLRILVVVALLLVFASVVVLGLILASPNR